jgi:hypothetical protein
MSDKQDGNTFRPKFNIGQDVWYFWGEGLQKAKVIGITLDWAQVTESNKQPTIEYSERYRIEQPHAANRYKGTVTVDMLAATKEEAVAILLRKAEAKEREEKEKGT